MEILLHIAPPPYRPPHCLPPSPLCLLPPSFLLSLSVLLCLSVTDTLFLFFSVKDETFPPA